MIFTKVNQRLLIVGIYFLALLVVSMLLILVLVPHQATSRLAVPPMRAELPEDLPSLVAQEKSAEGRRESPNPEAVRGSLDTSHNDPSRSESERSSIGEVQRLRGLVQDQFGQPLEDCSVELVIDGAPVNEVRTNRDGIFVIEVDSLADPHGGAQALLQASALPPDCMYNPIDAFEPQLDELNIVRVWRGISIRGTVVDQNTGSSPLKGTRIMAYCAAAHSSKGAAVNPDTGLFCLTPLIPGEWHIWAIGPLPRQVRSATSRVQAPLDNVLLELPIPLSIDYELKGVATVKDGWAYLVSNGYSDRKEDIGLSGQWMVTPGQYDMQVSVIDEENQCFWGTLKGLLVEEHESLVVKLEKACSLKIRYQGDDAVAIGVFANRVLLDSRIYSPGEHANLVAPLDSNIELHLTSNGDTMLVHEEHVPSHCPDEGITVLIP